MSCYPFRERVFLSPSPRMRSPLLLLAAKLTLPPATQALAVVREMRNTDMILMLIICSASLLLLYVAVIAAMRHNTQRCGPRVCLVKNNQPRSAS